MAAGSSSCRGHNRAWACLAEDGYALAKFIATLCTLLLLLSLSADHAENSLAKLQLFGLLQAIAAPRSCTYMLKKLCKLHSVCHSHIAGPPQPLDHWFRLSHRYLVSRGSLLLTVIDTQGQQQLLSLQEATHLMVRLFQHTFQPVADELTHQSVLAYVLCLILASESVVKLSAVAYAGVCWSQRCSIPSVLSLDEGGLHSGQARSFCLLLACPASHCMHTLLPTIAMCYTHQPFMQHICYSVLHCRHPATWVVDDDAKPSQQQEQGRQVQQQPRPETTAVAELSKTPKHVMQVCSCLRLYKAILSWHANFPAKSAVEAHYSMASRPLYHHKAHKHTQS